MSIRLRGNTNHCNFKTPKLRFGEQVDRKKWSSYILSMRSILDCVLFCHVITSRRKIVSTWTFLHLWRQLTQWKVLSPPGTSTRHQTIMSAPLNCTRNALRAEWVSKVNFLCCRNVVWCEERWQCHTIKNLVFSFGLQMFSFLLFRVGNVQIFPAGQSMHWSWLMGFNGRQPAIILASILL